MKLWKDKFLKKKKYWVSTLIVLLIAFSLFSVYSYSRLTMPGYAQKKESLPLYSLEASYEHSSSVEKENPLWPVGTILKNQSFYFPSVDPVLNGKFHFQIRPPSTSSVNVLANYQTKTILSCSRNDRIYWSKEETIAEGRTMLAETNELKSRFQLNTTIIEEEVREIKQKLNFYTGKIRLEVVTVVNYQGEIGNERIKEEKEFSLPIKISGSHWEIGVKSYEEEVEKEVTSLVTVPISNGKKMVLIAPPVVLFMAILCLLVARVSYKPLNEKETEELRREKEYQKFEDQISWGKYPSNLERDKEIIEIKSLGDLIGVSVDTDKRVIRDKEKGIYFVIDEDILYIYRP